MRKDFWLYNPKILLDNYHIFFPQSNFSLIKNLNAIVRLVLYYLIICILISYKIEDAIQLFLITCIISILIYNLHNREHFTNHDVITVKRTSTKDNPVMNPTVLDYNSNKKIVTDDSVNNEILNKNIVDGLSYEINSSSKKLIERNFYPMPVKNVVNEQTEFAKFLYDTGPTCKEKTIMCYNSLPDRLDMGGNLP